MRNPTFTIITATYNSANTLPNLLQSLAGQTCRDFNVIIQDGASKDNTIDIARQFSPQLPELLIDSRADSGIYQAWNRAVDQWRDNLGEWILFLGADDTLASPETLHLVTEKLQKEPPAEDTLFLAGDVLLCDGKHVLTSMPGLRDNVREHFRKGESAVHSALFQRHTLFRQAPFDESFRISGDHDFVIRHWQRDEDGYNLDLPVTHMSIGGVTSSLQNVLRFRYEVARVIFRHFGLYAACKRVPGILKALFPFMLTKIFPEKLALSNYNLIRNLRGLDKSRSK